MLLIVSQWVRNVPSREKHDSLGLNCRQKKKTYSPGMVAHNFHPKPQEAEAGVSVFRA